MKLTRALGMAIATMSLYGCAAGQYNGKMFKNQRPSSVAERNSVVEYIRAHYYDPHSIQDVEISTVATSMGLDSVKTLNICVRGNAKNGFGAYTGLKTNQFYMYEDLKIYKWDTGGFSSMFCNELTYSPFPELMKLNSH